MEENLPQGERKKISAELFKKLFLANSDEAFESYKDLHKEIRDASIYRLTAQEISEQTNGVAPGNNEKKYTAVFNLEIEGDVEIDDLMENVEHPLFCFNCKFSVYKLSGSNKSFDSLRFFRCELGEFESVGLSFENLIFEMKTNTVYVKISNCRIKNYEIHNSNSGNLIFSDVEMHSFNVQNKSKISDIIINKKSKINGLTISLSKTGFIQIYDSTIQQCLINSNCEITALKTGFDSIVGVIIISSSNINDLNFNKTRLDSFKAENSFINEIIITNESTIERISFRKCQKIGAFDFEQRSKIGNIYFSKCNTADLSFERGDVRYFYFYESYSKSLSIKNCVFGKIYIHGSSKSGDISIESSKTGFILIEEQFCSLFLIGAQIPLLELKNCHIPIFEMRMANQVEAYVKDGHINLISFEKTNLGNNTTISFSGVTVYSLIFDESVVSGALYFRSIIKAQQAFEWWHEVNPKYDITESSFQKQINDELANDYDKACKELTGKFSEPTLRISNSSLGKTQFINFPFHEFDFQFNNSKIDDCFILGDKFPSTNINIVDEKGGIFSQNEIDTKRQLASLNIQFKKIFEAQGDAYSAAQFQAKWAEHQKNYLELNYNFQKKEATLWRRPWERLGLIFGELSQDIGIFRLNKWSNNHGESWVRALAFTGISTGILYVLFLWSIDRCFNSNGLDWNLFGYYFEFLTPTFKPDFITGERPSSCSIGLYYAGKAVFAYGLYQFIAAFRKHGRKK